ncbi:hypothetical protein EHJ37_11440 [Vibrio parahaemolyticus]|nr:hypothetical protein [Vibrio parahaemolyticus]
MFMIFQFPAQISKSSIQSIIVQTDYTAFRFSHLLFKIIWQWKAPRAVVIQANLNSCSCPHTNGIALPKIGYFAKLGELSIR